MVGRLCLSLHNFFAIVGQNHRFSLMIYELSYSQTIVKERISFHLNLLHVELIREEFFYKANKYETKTEL